MSRFISILMSAVLALCLLAVRVEAKAASVRLEPEVALGAFTGLVEEHLAGILRTEKAIAASPEAKSARWDAVQPMLDRFAQDLPTDATVWFMMPDGSYYSTAKGGLTDQNLKDRSYFPKLVAGQEVLGELVISKSTGQRSIIVAVPVIASGKVVAAVGVSVDAVKLAELVESRMTLPDNAYLLLRARCQDQSHAAPLSGPDVQNGFRNRQRKPRGRLQGGDGQGAWRVQLFARRQEDSLDFPEIPGAWLVLLHRKAMQVR